MRKISKAVKFSEFLTALDKRCERLASERRTEERFRKLQEFRERPTEEIVKELAKEVGL